MRGFFEQRDVDADPLQRDRSGEPADAAANDQRANGRLLRLATASRARLVCARGGRLAVKGLLANFSRLRPCASPCILPQRQKRSAAWEPKNDWNVPLAPLPRKSDKLE